MFEFCKVVCNFGVWNASIYEYRLWFYNIWLNARVFYVQGVKWLKELVHEHVGILYSKILKDDVYIVTQSLYWRHLPPH